MMEPSASELNHVVIPRMKICGEANKVTTDSTDEPVQRMYFDLCADTSERPNATNWRELLNAEDVLSLLYVGGEVRECITAQFKAVQGNDATPKNRCRGMHCEALENVVERCPNAKQGLIVSIV